MQFSRKSKNEKKEKIVVSFASKIGIVAIRSLEAYIRKIRLSSVILLQNHLPIRML